MLALDMKKNTPEYMVAYDYLKGQLGK